MVRVDVEEGVGLRADKVVGRRRPAACDADRLRELEDGLRPTNLVNIPPKAKQCTKRTLIAS